jgi:hypothetical protein
MGGCSNFRCTTSLLYATNVLLGIYRSELNQGSFGLRAQVIVLPTRQGLHQANNLKNT